MYIYGSRRSAQVSGSVQSVRATWDRPLGTLRISMTQDSFFSCVLVSLIFFPFFFG